MKLSLFKILFENELNLTHMYQTRNTTRAKYYHLFQIFVKIISIFEILYMDIMGEIT